MCLRIRASTPWPLPPPPVSRRCIGALRVRTCRVWYAASVAGSSQSRSRSSRTDHESCRSSASTLRQPSHVDPKKGWCRESSSSPVCSYIQLWASPWGTRVPRRCCGPRSTVRGPYASSGTRRGGGSSSSSGRVGGGSSGSVVRKGRGLGGGRRAAGAVYRECKRNMQLVVLSECGQWEWSWWWLHDGRVGAGVH